MSLMKTKNKVFAVVALVMMAASGTAGAVPVAWTDWTSFSQTSASGTMDGVSVTVTSSIMNGPSQTSCGTNYWTEPDPADPAYTGGTVDNAPTPCEQIGLSLPASVSVTFGSAIDNLYMALLSVGQPGVAVTYDFDQSFAIDSEGRGFWGNDATDGTPGPNDTLTMREFHGVLLFDAPVTNLTFTTAPNENWHAFTFGSAATNVPEPSIMALFAAGLLGLGVARRRMRS